MILPKVILLNFKHNFTLVQQESGSALKELEKKLEEVSKVTNVTHKYMYGAVFVHP